MWVPPSSIFVFHLAALVVEGLKHEMSIQRCSKRKQLWKAVIFSVSSLHSTLILFQKSTSREKKSTINNEKQVNSTKLIYKSIHFFISLHQFTTF